LRLATVQPFVTGEQQGTGYEEMEKWFPEQFHTEALIEVCQADPMTAAKP
jgi:hypothetical protein